MRHTRTMGKNIFYIIYAVFIIFHSNRSLFYNTAALYTPLWLDTLQSVELVQLQRWVRK